MAESCEQKARDMLERLSGATHYTDPQRLTAGDVVELAQLFAEIKQLKQALQRIVDDWPYRSEYSLKEAVKALGVIDDI